MESEIRIKRELEGQGCSGNDCSDDSRSRQCSGREDKSNGSKMIKMEEGELEVKLESDSNSDDASNESDFADETSGSEEKHWKEDEEQHGAFVHNWNPDAVPMPFSLKNRRVIQVMQPSFPESNGRDELPIQRIKTEEEQEMVVSTWDLIVNTLSTRICSCDELNDRINTIMDSATYFNVLKYTIEQEMSSDEGYNFFDKVLPFIVNLCLELPNLCIREIPLLQQKRRERGIRCSFKPKTVASLMANAFFCTFPQRLERNDNYPAINFYELYSCDPMDVRMPAMVQRLRSILHYFERLEKDGFGKRTPACVNFKRFHQVPEQWLGLNSLLDGFAPGCRRSEALKIEGVEFLQQNSLPNLKCGCGKSRSGAVEEELLFMIYPELIISRLFMEKLLPGEVMQVTGLKRFANVKANAHDKNLPFLFAGDFLRCSNVNKEHIKAKTVQIAILVDNPNQEEASPSFRSTLGFGCLGLIRIGSQSTFSNPTPLSTTAPPKRKLTNRQRRRRKQVAAAMQRNSPNACQATQKDMKLRGLKYTKIALLLSYCRLDVFSEQGSRSLENELQDAMVRSQLHVRRFSISQKLREETSAARQIVTFKAPPQFNIAAFNEQLPFNVRAMGYRRASNNFGSGVSATTITYTYLIPTYAFAPVETVLQQDYKISSEVLTQAKLLFSRYNGLDNITWNNFTFPARTGSITSFECSDPFPMENFQYVTLRVKGRKFHNYQIEKMVGLCVAILRGAAPAEIFERVFQNGSGINIPQVPTLGLILEDLEYKRYNDIHGACAHEQICWDDLRGKVEKFCSKYIHSNILKNEKEKTEKSIWYWLTTTLTSHIYDAPHE